MTTEVEKSMKQLVEKARKMGFEQYIDGYTGFIVRTREGLVRGGDDFNKLIRRALLAYRRAHPDEPLFEVTPHIFRHTFCTNMLHAGVEIKELQYLMGLPMRALPLMSTHIRSTKKQKNRCSRL